MKFPSQVQLWQHPYVDIFKQIKEMQLQIAQKGDVEEFVDKDIRKKVFRIRGNVAASNYLQIPKNSSISGNGLGLTGKYIYIEIKQNLKKNCVFHLDFLTSTKNSLRFSFSTMYTSFKAVGSVLRVPLKISDKWTVVAIDAHELLNQYSFNNHSHGIYELLKGIKLCSSMCVRGVFTSDIIFVPSTLPNSMKFPHSAKARSNAKNSTNAWQNVYSWEWFPESPFTVANKIKSDEQSKKLKSKSLNSSILSESKLLSSMLNEKDPSKIKSTKHGAPQKASICDEKENSMDRFDYEQDCYLKSSISKEKILENERASILRQADKVLKKAGLEAYVSSHTSSEDPQALTLQQQRLMIDKPTSKTLKSPTNKDNTWPDPIISLDKVIGFSGTHRKSLLWTNDCLSCVFASLSTLVVLQFKHQKELSPDESLSQRFFFGHTQAISILVFPHGNNNYLVSGQEGKNATIRIWDFATGCCLDVLKTHEKGLIDFVFSNDNQFFAVVGYDLSFRVQVLVYKVEFDEPKRSYCNFNVIAKQTCEFPVTRLAFCPYDSSTTRIISCGRENIRFWRIRKGHLPGCPVILNEYARDTVFTDIAFDQFYVGHNKQQNRPVYVSTSVGTVVVLDYDTMEVQNVFRLHDGSINCMATSEGFVVTGSDDCYVRVWPVDFSDFFLEAQHEAGISSVEISLDGLHVLVGTQKGSVGMLQLSNQQYETLMRSHAGDIHSVAVSSQQLVLATSSASDGTIRVWDLLKGQQSYEFTLSETNLMATCMSFHPLKPILAVGFASGAMRIFDIKQILILEEHQQHREGGIFCIHYSCQGDTLYTLGYDSQLCLYDVHRGYYPKQIVSLNDLGFWLSADKKTSQHSRVTFSQNSNFFALIGGGENQDTIQLIDAVKIEKVRKFEYSKKEITSEGFRLVKIGFQHILFSPHNKELMAVMSTNRIVWFCVETGAVLRSISSISHGKIVHICLSPNGRYVSTTDEYNSIQIWDYFTKTATLENFQSFVGHCHSISSICFAGSGERIVSTGSDNAIYIWNFRGDTKVIKDIEDSIFVQDSLSDIDINEDNNFVLSKIQPMDFSIEDSFPQPNTVVPKPMCFSLLLQHDEKQNSSTLAKVFSPSNSTVSETQELELTSSTSISLNLERIQGAINLNLNLAFVWVPSNGMLLFSIGCYLVLEKLDNAKQYVCSGHTTDIESFAICADKIVSIGVSHRQILVWNWNGEMIGCLPPLDQFESSLLFLKFVAHDQYLLCVFSNCVKLYTMGSNQDASCCCSLEVDNEFFVDCNVAEYPGNDCLFVSSTTTFNKLTLWGWSHSEQELAVVREISMELSPNYFIEIQPRNDIGIITVMKVFPNIGKQGTLLSGTSTGWVLVFDFASHEILYYWHISNKKNKRSIGYIDWTGKEYILVVCKSSKVLHIFKVPFLGAEFVDVDIINWKSLHAKGFKKNSSVLFENDIVSCSWGNQQEGLVYTLSGNLWHLNIQTEKKSIFKANTLVSLYKFKQLVYLSNLNILATIDEITGSLNLWEADNLNEIISFQGDKLDMSDDRSSFLMCTCLASNYNNIVAVGYENGSIRFFNCEKLELFRICLPFEDLREEQFAIEHVSFLQENILLVTNAKGSLVILDLKLRGGRSAGTRVNSNSYESVKIHMKRVSFPLPKQLTDQERLKDSQLGQISFVRCCPISPQEMFLVGLRFTGFVQVIVFHEYGPGSSMKNKAPVVIDTWTLILEEFDAVFSNLSPNVIIYSNYSKQRKNADTIKQPCVEFRCCQRQQLLRRVVLDIFPKNLQAIQNGDDSYLLVSGPVGKFFLISLDDKKNEYDKEVIEILLCEQIQKSTSFSSFAKVIFVKDNYLVIFEREYMYLCRLSDSI